MAVLVMWSERPLVADLPWLSLIWWTNQIWTVVLGVWWCVVGRRRSLCRIRACVACSTDSGPLPLCSSCLCSCRTEFAAGGTALYTASSEKQYQEIWVSKYLLKDADFIHIYEYIITQMYWIALYLHHVQIVWDVRFQTGFYKSKHTSTETSTFSNWTS